MKTKCLAVGIILLFIGTAIIPSATSEQIHGKNIITVDDEPGLADYTSIHDAVNHANPGDTIEVYSGTYNESNITITISNLTLQGKPHDLPGGDDTGKPLIINPLHYYSIMGAVNVVSTNNISIRGFKIIPLAPSQGRQVFVSSVSHFLFSDNDAVLPWGSYNCSTLIVVEESSYVVIENNTIVHGHNQIEVFDSHDCWIMNNTLLNSSLVSVGFTGSNTTISGNVIDYAYEDAISISGTNIHVTKNRISNSGVGVDLEYSGHVLVDYNEIRNDSMAVAVTQVGALSTRVTHNNFFNSGMNTFLLECPLLLSNLIFQQNYYGRPHFLPKPLLGFFLIFLSGGEVPMGIPIPWFCFDWHPAQEPYDIPGMT